MAAARTDREYADRIPAPRPLTTDRTNSHHRDLHQHNAGLENDLRSQTRAVREALAERDQALAQVAELTAKLEDRRVRLRDADNDLLDVRGILSPNGYPQRVPVDLVPTVAPAVRWLADRVDALQPLIAAAHTWRTWYGNTNPSYATACNDLAAAIDALPPALGSAPPRAQDDEATPRRLLDQAIESALPQAGGNVRPLLKALRRELKRVDAKRAERAEREG